MLYKLDLRWTSYLYLAVYGFWLVTSLSQEPTIFDDMIFIFFQVPIHILFLSVVLIRSAKSEAPALKYVVCLGILALGVVSIGIHYLT